MLDNKTASAPEQFTSAKTTAAIPISHPAIRDALIQFSLDAAVRSIDYIGGAIVGSEHVDIGAVFRCEKDDLFEAGLHTFCVRLC
ncbi:hypothetical protein SAMN05216338_104548 [Bradyrhizobium sp. Rc2d]|uniref:hypothetical protein n=1 Tax=Bradyrhizobium sp. Rc2d TaxID=1855321 RepID=UPI00088CFA8C|nr:hypothetical protein [Bradyrhizobium sp. Rc2d]SDJ30169.1 hypothetical protein SAMN05216338_104548 [Bradyrhizobium sp. Rc2d]